MLKQLDKAYRKILGLILLVTLSKGGLMGQAGQHDPFPRCDGSAIGIFVYGGGGTGTDILPDSGNYHPQAITNRYWNVGFHFDAPMSKSMAFRVSGSMGRQGYDLGLNESDTDPFALGNYSPNMLRFGDFHLGLKYSPSCHRKLAPFATFGGTIQWLTPVHWWYLRGTYLNGIIDKSGGTRFGLQASVGARLKLHANHNLSAEIRGQYFTSPMIAGRYEYISPQMLVPSYGRYNIHGHTVAFGLAYHFTNEGRAIQSTDIGADGKQMYPEHALYLSYHASAHKGGISLSDPEGVLATIRTPFSPGGSFSLWYENDGRLQFYFRVMKHAIWAGFGHRDMPQPTFPFFAFNNSHPSFSSLNSPYYATEDVTVGILGAGYRFHSREGKYLFEARLGAGFGAPGTANVLPLPLLLFYVYDFDTFNMVVEQLSSKPALFFNAALARDWALMPGLSLNTGVDFLLGSLPMQSYHITLTSNSNPQPKQEARVYFRGSSVSLQLGLKYRLTAWQSRK